jgi:hypothetical protein
MTHFLTAISIHMETEDAHLCHSGDEFPRKGSFVEMVRYQRHAFFIHKLPDPVSIKPLCFCQKRFRSVIIDHVFYPITVDKATKLISSPIKGEGIGLEILILRGWFVQIKQIVIRTPF